MDCHFTEKISLLIDGELRAEETGEVLAHLETCEVCQQAQADYLSLRAEIKSYTHEAEAGAYRDTLRRILAAERPPLWRRSIALPLPAFALLLAAVVALGVWTAWLQRRPAPTEADRKPGRVLTLPAPAQRGTQDALDLARFDRGERAAIYKVRRTDQDGVERR